MHRVVLAPAGTPQEALDTLGEAFQALGEDPTFTNMMSQMGENIEIIAGPDYEAMRDEQDAAYEDLVKALTSQ
jgi:tripartite-type tricarboxylate transporter receptor subunit TctC